LLGKNIFKGQTAEESRQRMINMPIPDFRNLDQRVDERLNEILHRTLARDLDKRYASADELLYELEHYIYHSGYGPTNETMGKFIRELFAQAMPSGDSALPHGTTTLMEAARPYTNQ
jgi:serine/threonine-protein kinase